MPHRRIAVPLVVVSLALCAAACSSEVDRTEPGRTEPPPGDPGDPGVAGVRRIGNPSGPGAMAANLAQSPAGGVVLSWLEPGDGRSMRLRWSRLGGSGVQGERWTAARTIVEGRRFFANWADFPSIAVRDDGAMIAHWLERSGDERYAYDVRLARADPADPADPPHESGVVWQTIGSPHADATKTEHGFVSIVAEAARFRVFWLDGREMVEDGGRMALRTVAIGDGDGDGDAGSVAQDGLVLDPDVCTCCQTGAARTGKGTIVVYRDREAGEIRDVSIVRETPTGWSEPAPVSRDGWVIAGCPVNGPAIDAAGERVVVAWFTAAGDEGRVLVAWSHDAGEHFGPPLVVDGDRPHGRVAVACVDGGAAVAWLANEDGAAALRIRRLAADGRLGAPLTLARLRSSRSTGFPRTVRDGDRLVVVWREVGAGRSSLRTAIVDLDALP